MENIGKVVQIIGPVIDIHFEEKLPNIYNAIRIPLENGDEIVTEVHSHIGNNIVRTVSMSATEGLRRETKAIDTGNAITVPVGKNTLGRIFNVLGKPVDEMGEVVSENYEPIHKPAPKFEDQGVGTEILETGIKVVDLLAPYLKGGKIGLFGGAGVGKLF